MGAPKANIAGRIAFVPPTSMKTFAKSIKKVKRLAELGKPIGPGAGSTQVLIHTLVTRRCLPTLWIHLGRSMAAGWRC